MSEYVIDAHTLIWHLTAAPRLSEKVVEILADADAGMHRIYVPGIVLVEMLYLTDKKRLSSGLLDQALALLQVPNGSYATAPLDIAVVQAMRQVPHAIVPDMPDRIIVATALYLGLPLLSKDRAFSNVAGLQVVW